MTQDRLDSLYEKHHDERDDEAELRARAAGDQRQQEIDADQSAICLEADPCRTCGCQPRWESGPGWMLVCRECYCAALTHHVGYHANGPTESDTIDHWNEQQKETT